MNSTDRPNDLERRIFFKKAGAVILGGLTAAVPVGAGLAVFLDPLRRRAELGALVRVTTLESLPADGVPRKFQVVADRIDAWNRFPQVPVGAVYLRRTDESRIEALNVVCPHAGCFVDYIPARQSFLCPCHNSAFGLDGRIADPKSPSPRPLDTLEVEIRNETEVWVKFQNYRAGQAAKVPLA